MTEPDTASDIPVRSWAELRDTGLLWLVNRVVFHPRGFALAFVLDDGGQPTGWALLGDGRHPWIYELDPEEETRFTSAEALFAACRAPDPAQAGTAVVEERIAKAVVRLLLQAQEGDADGGP